MMNPFIVTYLQTTERSLGVATNSLLDNIQGIDNCISLVFFGSVTNATFEAEIQLIKSIVYQRFKFLPLVSLVPQSLCGENTYGLEITTLNNNLTHSKIDYKTYDDIHYAIADLDWGKTLVVENVCFLESGTGFSEQNVAVFKLVNLILQIEGFNAQHIVRQWNYVGDITGFENGNQHYQLFNNARSRYYESANFSNGYPAATGISMSVNSLFISLIAILPTNQTVIKPIDNSLQIPAHKYSCSVLIDCKAETLKSTPKFERAKWVSDNSTEILYISGTAAIRDEKSSDKNDAALQTSETIDIINFLISNENLNANNLILDESLKLSSIRVYVKNNADYEVIKRQVEAAWPNVKSIYLQAGVCRQELLVEIEGIAEVC